MQLDKTGIAIRERGLLDILDLALQTLRTYGLPLVAASAAGVVPFALLNAWLLHDLAQEADYTIEVPFDYIWLMLGLVILEMPLAGAPATLFLGQAMFRQKPEPVRIVKDLLRSLPQLILFQVILRAMMIPMVITLLVPMVMYPYLNEVILLERNPLRRRSSQGLSTLGRSRALHAGYAGDQFGRWGACLLIGTLMVLGLWLTLWFFRILLTNDRAFDQPMYTIMLPIAIWTVVGYFNVVRFLSYLDLRIRREGWEIELRMRAEGDRLTRQLA